jgi:hypothetical protein
MQASLQASCIRNETGPTPCSRALVTWSQLNSPHRYVCLFWYICATAASTSWQAYTFLREFILGNNATGLVTNSSGNTVVVGGENSTLAGNVLPGPAEIYYGSGTTQFTYTFPSATVAAWNGFIRTETAPSTTPTSKKTWGIKPCQWLHWWPSFVFWRRCGWIDMDGQLF